MTFAFNYFAIFVSNIAILQYLIQLQFHEYLFKVFMWYYIYFKISKSNDKDIFNDLLLSSI